VDIEQKLREERRKCGRPEVFCQKIGRKERNSAKI
jgi:hypothetical protein